MYQPKLYLKFNPPIYNDSVGNKQLRKVLGFIDNKYPEASWWEGQSPAEHNPFNVDEDIPDQVASLTIGYWPDGPNRLTYGQWDDNDMNHKNGVDGWLWLKDHEVDYDQTSDIFNQLNESQYQPKLNLRFEEPIYDADELDKVLKVLLSVYPNLQWKGGDLVSRHNVIRGYEEDYQYEPIYYLTIGFFSESPDKLTYTSAPDDDRSFADDEHYNYDWVNGWQWVRDNEVDYDQTTDIFNQLNESYDFLGQTNLKGFKFKKILQDNPKLWVIRTIISDNGDELYFEYEFSDAAIEILGSPQIYDGNLPKHGDMSKNGAINYINNGEWEIIEIPNFDTESFFD